MTETATIQLYDENSSDEAVAIVRHDTNNVALCLSLKSGGDVEVVMKKSDASKFFEALRRCIE